MIVTFDSEGFKKDIEPLISEFKNRDFPTAETTLTLAQTGVTALSRGMNAKLYSVGNAEYFAENIKDYLSSFDLTHASNESSFTDFANTKNICSDDVLIHKPTIPSGEYPYSLTVTEACPMLSPPIVCDAKKVETVSPYYQNYYVHLRRRFPRFQVKEFQVIN